MKRIALAIGLGAILILPLGLSSSMAQEPKKADKVTTEDIEKEVKETAKTSAAYTQQQREEYQKKIDAKLNEYGQELKEWKAKVAKKEEKVKAEMDQQIKEMNQKAEEASKKLKELKTKTGKAWEDLKAGMDSLMEDLAKSFDQIQSRFKK